MPGISHFEMSHQLSPTGGSSLSAKLSAGKLGVSMMVFFSIRPLQGVSITLKTGQVC